MVVNNELIEFLMELYDNDLEAILYECEMHPFDALSILLNEGHIQLPEFLKNDFREEQQG